LKDDSQTPQYPTLENEADNVILLLPLEPTENEEVPVMLIECINGEGVPTMLIERMNGMDFLTFQNFDCSFCANYFTAILLPENFEPKNDQAIVSSQVSVANTTSTQSSVNKVGKSGRVKDQILQKGTLKIIEELRKRICWSFW